MQMNQKNSFQHSSQNVPSATPSLRPLNTILSCLILTSGCFCLVTAVVSRLSEIFAASWKFENVAVQDQIAISTDSPDQAL